jgi:putative nucleotidyltransferase with HDIG domain
MTEELKAYGIVARLCRAGHEAFIAGGAARDLLAGETPEDYDVVTSASHEEVLQVFRYRKVSVVGLSFKICIVDGVEVATYRNDGTFGIDTPNGEGRRAETIAEDLGRRDLTINAMAFCPYNGDVVDPFGGASDLKNKIIRFTGDPYRRIHEDPLRMVRACRFRARMMGVFAPETFDAIKDCGHLLSKMAPERLRLEILKALSVEKPSMFFNDLHEAGMLRFISPGLESLYGHDGGRHHGETLDEHCAMVGDFLPRRMPLLRLAGYVHDIGKPGSAESTPRGLSFIDHEDRGAEIVRQELTRLSFSLKEIGYVSALVRHHMKSLGKTGKPKTVRRLLKKLADDGVSWKDWLLLKIADTRGNLKKEDYSREEIRSIVMKIHRELHPPSGRTVFSVSHLAINGYDVMTETGTVEGPEIGRILKLALDYVLDDPSRNTRDELLRFVRNRA